MGHLIIISPPPQRSSSLTPVLTFPKFPHQLSNSSPFTNPSQRQQVLKQDAGDTPCNNTFMHECLTKLLGTLISDAHGIISNTKSLRLKYEEYEREVNL